KRKDKHVVRIEMEGYQPYELSITRKTSGWVWGNIVFGGLIGLAVDAITGGLYKLNPEQVMGELAQKPTGAEIKDGVIYVTLISSPDKSLMTKIGDLVPRTVEP
ncbi:MAG TPA: PEGA domain-containing protein, partial [candidate division Zixibacteria bacterium]|nr:PEGA domain-containing protein [candidate division Zixibacteria bacterium]